MAGIFSFFLQHRKLVLMSAMGIGFGIVYLIIQGAGSRKTFYDDGQLKLEEGLMFGKRHGAVREYYPSGAIKSEKNYANGILHGIKNEYYDVNDDSPMQHLRNYDEEKKLRLKSTVEYVNGLREGKAMDYYRGGKVLNEWNFVADKGNLMNAFYKTGKIYIQTKFMPEKQLMVFRKFYRNGHLWQEGIIKDEKLNGPYRTYHPDGQPRSEGEMSDGAYVGGITLYDENGDITGIVDQYDPSVEEDPTSPGKWTGVDPDLLEEFNDE